MPLTNMSLIVCCIEVRWTTEIEKLRAQPLGSHGKDSHARSVCQLRGDPIVFNIARISGKELARPTTLPKLAPIKTRPNDEEPAPTKNNSVTRKLRIKGRKARECRNRFSAAATSARSARTPSWWVPPNGTLVTVRIAASIRVCCPFRPKQSSSKQTKLQGPKTNNHWKYLAAKKSFGKSHPNLGRGRLSFEGRGYRVFHHLVQATSSL